MTRKYAVHVLATIYKYQKSQQKSMFMHYFESFKKALCCLVLYDMIAFIQENTLNMQCKCWKYASEDFAMIHIREPT